MRFLFAMALAGFVLVSACAPHASCGCPTLAPTVTFTITDATTGDTIQDPIFSVDGASVSGQCIGVFPDDAGPDAGPICNQWRVTLSVGHSTVTVGAPGYQTQTFELDATSTGGCCSQGTQLNQQVVLSH